MRLFVKPLLILTTLCLLSSHAFAFGKVNFLSGTNPAATETHVLTPAQTKAVEGVIRDYLINNPKILVDVFSALRAQEAKAHETQAKKAIGAHASEIFHAPLSPIMGNVRGDVNLVEFLDYRCQHCKEMGVTIAQLLKADTHIKVIIKQLPIFGAESEYAAKAALASQRQGQFQAFHEALLQAKMPLNKQSILKIAKRLKLNIKQWRHDMQSPTVKQQIKDNIQLAEALAIAGTPAFIIANQAVVHPQYIVGSADMKTLKQAIKTARAQSQKSS